jgi:GT2 family glycosyltransferase
VAFVDGRAGESDTRPVPACSVVVVNWNGRQHLDTCLNALGRQTFTDFEIILVDNGSTDGSADHVRTCYPRVEVVALPENRGFCAGSNEGIRRARGWCVALLNNDTEADPNWLHELVSTMERRGVGICASQILFFDDRHILDSAGDDFSISGVASKRGHLQEASGNTEPEEVFGASAAAALYRRSMLEDIGLLDEDFFLIFEDADLSFRARSAGYRCVYVPTARVYHKTNASIGTYSQTYVYYGQRNVELTYLKNMPALLLLKYLPVHLLYNVLALAFFSSQGRAGSFLHAKGSALWCLPATLRKRRHIQARRVLASGQIDALLERRWLAQRWAEKGPGRRKGALPGR